MVALPADILVVEPDAREAQRYVDLFAVGVAGCVRVAAGVEEALDLLERGEDGCTPHLIVVDVDAPLARGVELVRRLRDDWRTRTIPILAVASEPDEELALELGRAGASATVAKPLDVEKFVEAAGAVSLYWRAQSGSSEGAPA